MNYDPNTGQPIYNGNQQPVQPQQQGGTNGFAIAAIQLGYNNRVVYVRCSDYTKYDFVKVPHHGRDELSTDYLLYVVNPSDVLITSSREEPENPEVLEKFQAAGAKIWLTRDGTVTMTVKEDGLSISQ